MFIIIKAQIAQSSYILAKPDDLMYGKNSQVVRFILRVLRVNVEHFSDNLRAVGQANALAISGDKNGIVLVEDTSEHGVGQRLDELALNRAAYRTRAVRWIVALASQVFDGASVQGEVHALVVNALR